MLFLPFLAVTVATLLAFVLKGITELSRGNGFRPFGLGGMPSAHSAAVTSLAIAVFIEDGWSLLFLVVVVFAVVVLRDASGVRWEVTRHSVALNKLTKSSDYRRTGHTNLEVAAGAVVGVLVTMLVYWLVPVSLLG